MKGLEEALRRTGGKATEGVAEVRAEFGDRATFLNELVGLAAHDEATVSDGATWLIKACLDDGSHLSGAETEALLGRLEAITSWQAQLHLCQSLGQLEVAKHQTSAVANWITLLLTSDRPFLRAWSMDALQQLASRNASLAKRAEAALQAAEQDPAASVRARARRWKKGKTRGPTGREFEPL